MISIVMATYNRAALLPRAIDSILAQSWREWELIVVDDGSTDDTAAVMAERYADPRIRYHRLERNRGATYARNYGLDRVRGDYFLVWDSDDVLYPEALATVRAAFDGHDGLAVVSAPARTLKGGRDVPYPRLPTGLLPQDELLCRILPPSNDKVKLHSVRLCGDIRYQAKNIDFLINVRSAQRGGWWHLDRQLADVHLEADAVSLTGGRKRPSAEWSKARAPYLAAWLAEVGGIMKRKFPRQYAAFAYGTALGLLLRGETRAARRLAGESARYSGGHPWYVVLWIVSWLPGAPRLLAWSFRWQSRR